MNLTLTKSMLSPWGMHLNFVYPLDARGVFLVTSEWQIIFVRPDGSIDVIWQTTEEDVAHKWRGLYDDRLTAQLYDEIRQATSGHKLLKKEDYERIDRSGLYTSPRVLTPFLCQGHDNTILALAGKSMTLLRLEGDQVTEHAKTRTKGRDSTTTTLHPEKNLIVYGTNHGELFAQPFDKESFGKAIKIDMLPNTCYQVSFSADGARLFAAGLGYVKIYGYDGKDFTLSTSVATAVRSFALVEDYLVLNKGMHGIEVLRIADKPERVTSTDLPFMIDKMYYLAPQKTFLLISGSTHEWALVNWTDHK